MPWILLIRAPSRGQATPLGWSLGFSARRPETSQDVSFVEDKDFRPGRTSVGTHSDMLTRADVVPPELRFRKRAAARSEPYEYLKSTLLSLGTKTK